LPAAIAARNAFGRKADVAPFPAYSVTRVFGLVTPMSGAITAHPHFTDDIVRAGLNYQFHRSVDQSGERD
jgi:hypothetical protein